MKFLIVGIGIIVAFCGVQDALEISAEDCQKEGHSDCLYYTLCMEETDLNIYPGKMKTLAYSLLVPRGLTAIASLVVRTPTGMSVILMGVKLLYQDDIVSIQNNTYIPKLTKTTHVMFSNEGTLELGHIYCNISTGVVDVTMEPTNVSSSTLPQNDTNAVNNTSNDFTTTVPIEVSTEDPCAYCLIQFAVETLIADLSGVSENSTQTLKATLYADTITMTISTKLIMKTSYTYNSSKTPRVYTSIPDGEELSVGKGKPFTFQTIFPYPLASYKITVKSESSRLRIVSLEVLSVGSHFSDILIIPSFPKVVGSDICSGGPDTRDINFGPLPNFGAYYESSTLDSDTIVFEMLLLVIMNAVPGDRYRLDIVLEVDGTEVGNITHYINVTQRIIDQNIRANHYQSSSFLAKNERGSATVTVWVPPLSSGGYIIQVASRKYAGPGGNGLMIGGIDLIDEIKQSNFPCVPPSKFWKYATTMAFHVINVPLSPTGENIFGYKVYVIAMGDVVEAHSSHELSVTFSYPGERSPEVFQIYFNITTAEIFTSPGDLRMSLTESCRSITPTTHVTLQLHTKQNAYGRIELEAPVPSGQTGQSFMLCSIGDVSTGTNVFTKVQKTITKRPDNMIEKILVVFSPLVNIFLVSSDGVTPNLLTMPMVGTFIDDSPQWNTQQTSFTARLLSNNKTVWTQELPITKPPIKHYPAFIVMTSVVKLAGVNANHLAYHYSRNGSYFYRQNIVWPSGRNTYVFEYPKVISSFYFSTPPCTIICDVTTTWQPLTNYMNIENDKTSVIRKNVPYILDQDLNTCITLPLSGDSPPLFWLRFTKLSLVRVTSQNFKVRVTGDGIECARIGPKQLMVGVSGPCHNTRCSVDSDLVFCEFVASTNVNTLTRCELQCKCPSPSRCTDVQIVLISNNHDDWSLCEISMEDV